MKTTISEAASTPATRPTPTAAARGRRSSTPARYALRAIPTFPQHLLLWKRCNRVGIAPNAPTARVLVAAAAAALALAAVGCGGDGDTSLVDKVAEARRVQAERVARDAGLPANVQRFLGQAAAGVGATYTVVYRSVGAKTTTLLQRPPGRRFDVTDGATTESVIRTSDGTFACRREGEKPWTCTRRALPADPDPDLGVFSQDRVAETVEALASAKSGYRFDVEERTVARVKATCLVTTPTAGGDPDEFCISKEGAVLRVRSATQSLEAESYKAKADAAAMKLPAPVTPG